MRINYNNIHQSTIIMAMHCSCRMYEFIFHNASILFVVNVMLQQHQFKLHGKASIHI